MLELVKKFASFVFETVKVVVFSLAIILPIRFFLIQPFYVEGASMEPSFHPREYLIIDEISYRFNDPKRGDVIVFRYPRNRSEFYIKRVIGLPGERVKIVEGDVFVNDRQLTESYISDLNLSSDSQAEVELQEGEYFVMGDNRANSLDSRVFGPVPESFLIGKVWLRGWPISRIGVFDAPEY